MTAGVTSTTLAVISTTVPDLTTYSVATDKYSQIARSADKVFKGDTLAIQYGESTRLGTST